ncbi:MAG: Flp pilus assembly protein CpaB [Sphingorhabdus sp.]
MDRKKVILLVGALLIAAVTAFMARSMFTGASAPQAQAIAKSVPTGPEILVATRALPVGTIITADSFRYQPWPKELVEEAYFAKVGDDQPKMEDLVGTVVRHAVTAGQPITKGSLVSPGDRGFLAAALGPGMRAVTVPVSSLTGVAGFIFPGDRVDLVLTQNVKDASPDTRPLKVAETIMRNLRVLATDQRARPSKDKDGNVVVAKYKLVTLEATPAIAERISVALSIGTISLSLRSLAENQAELEQALASGDLSIPEGASAEEEERILAKAKQRPSSGVSSYTTGGQVSRFQRQRYQPKPKTDDQVMRKAVRMQERAVKMQKHVEKVRKGPVVRVSRGGSVSEVKLDRR